MQRSSFTACPGADCGAPATVTDRFVCESTEGPVEHVVVVCANTPRHTFRCATEALARSTPTTTRLPLLRAG